MIIGNGMVAQAFEKFRNNDEVVIFASGVSNSKENSEHAFKREEILLTDVLHTMKHKTMIYFSTCSIYDSYFKKSPYTSHKIKMESIIQKTTSNYYIFRLPQILGLNNSNQLVKYLYDKITLQEPFFLYDIERNLIDISDAVYIINEILSQKQPLSERIINIANPQNIKVLTLVKILEKICDQKAFYTLIPLNGHFNIDIEPIKKIIFSDAVFEENYFENRIKKYYG